jgi:hypothetical protein
MAMRDAFPFLDSEGYTETSPAASEYNCIAWAAGRTDVAWWPDPQGIGYWPESAPAPKHSRHFTSRSSRSAILAAPTAALMQNLRKSPCTR